MNARKLLTEALIPALRLVFPQAEPVDLLFFGSEADICSPLPAKYGVDTSAEMVYNAVNGVTLGGFPLFCCTRINGGYIEFTLSDEALSELARLCAAPEAKPPSKPFDHGRNADSVAARLIWLANGGAGFYPPHDPILKKAFLACLLADTESSRQRALSLAEKALCLSRRARMSGGEALSPGAALCMAAALLEKCPSLRSVGEPENEQNTLI